MYKYFKRIMDFVASITALIILSPLIALSAVLVKISDGGSVIFKQRRPGKDGKIFTVYKFRTMSEKTEDENGRELSDVERMTKIGSFLRKTSLDELPQLFNVLKGDMSFIGPRPLLCEYLELYTPYQMRRHEVLPGISGLAQVNGRNAITWEEKFDYDVYYVDHMGFWLDLKIIFKTIKNTLKRADINCSDINAMEKFRGTPAAKEKR